MSPLLTYRVPCRTEGIAIGAEEMRLGKKLTPASDVYSLGCVLYELLSGDKVFHGETFFEAMNQHVSEKPQKFAAKLAVPEAV